MPRIQILALPEGADDERPPFFLIIDQAPYDGALATQLRDEASVNIDLAERTGARGILLFEDTVDIPANNPSAYLAPIVNVHVDNPTNMDDTALADQIRRGIESAQAAHYGRTA